MPRTPVYANRLVDKLLNVVVPQLSPFRAGFKRSKRGNLWRVHRLGDADVTLTVFKRPDGLFAFCMADSDGPHWSERNFETEDDAVNALQAALEAWEQSEAA